MSARVEEARVARIQLDKQARLQNFQEEVKRRVMALDRIKKTQQMNELLKAVRLLKFLLFRLFFILLIDFKKNDRINDEVI